MTELLKTALQMVSALPQEEQDAIASQILAELNDEAAWRQKLAASLPKLRALAEQALSEHHRGETCPLDDLL